MELLYRLIIVLHCWPVISPSISASVSPWWQTNKTDRSDEEVDKDATTTKQVGGVCVCVCLPACLSLSVCLGPFPSPSPRRIINNACLPDDDDEEVRSDDQATTTDQVSKLSSLSVLSCLPRTLPDREMLHRQCPPDPEQVSTYCKLSCVLSCLSVFPGPSPTERRIIDSARPPEQPWATK